MPIEITIDITRQEAQQVFDEVFDNVQDFLSALSHPDYQDSLKDAYWAGQQKDAEIANIFDTVLDHGARFSDACKRFCRANRHCFKLEPAKVNGPDGEEIRYYFHFKMKDYLDGLLPRYQVRVDAAKREKLASYKKGPKKLRPDFSVRVRLRGKRSRNPSDYDLNIYPCKGLDLRGIGLKYFNLVPTPNTGDVDFRGMYLPLSMSVVHISDPRIRLSLSEARKSAVRDNVIGGPNGVDITPKRKKQASVHRFFGAAGGVGGAAAAVLPPPPRVPAVVPPLRAPAPVNANANDDGGAAGVRVVDDDGSIAGSAAAAPAAFDDGAGAGAGAAVAQRDPLAMVLFPSSQGRRRRHDEIGDEEEENQDLRLAQEGLVEQGVNPEGGRKVRRTKSPTDITQGADRNGSGSSGEEVDDGAGAGLRRFGVGK